MWSARWERDRQVNADSSNTVNRGREECVSERKERERERQGKKSEMERVRNKKDLQSVLRSRVYGGCALLQV